MKKLIDSFKTYEHILSEDSVMHHFRNIINKGKKFAKLELKSCIEEFEEKINTFHIEKKEQELTAKNAEVHQQRVDTFETFRGAKEAGEENAESEVVGDSSTEVLSEFCDEVSKSRAVESEEYSGVSSELTESEPGDNEVQSAQCSRYDCHGHEQVGQPQVCRRLEDLNDGKNMNPTAHHKQKTSKRLFRHKAKKTGDQTCGHGSDEFAKESLYYSHILQALVM
ncbi:hypothetical protein RJ639_024693 [Escallonia herrerae]|uniref:Uncharacterized protein n=1 Tax=Escallonia herrerae TaxID=1293975 RepID=A0AA88V1J6_9ASTE|nr:hypothetical protein RJ639_024693 [Escallonia herrerae]